MRRVLQIGLAAFLFMLALSSLWVAIEGNLVAVGAGGANAGSPP